jgi:ATP-dependent Lhr-like helicase
MDRLRSEIEPVSAQDLLRYLFERHRLGRAAAGTEARPRAGGRTGLREAIAMLQGFEIAASAWEKDILPARVAGYRGEWLDELCLAGEVAWGRLTPRRIAATPAAPGQAASTSRATPIALAMRRDLGWLLSAVRTAGVPEPPTTEAPALAIDALRRRGALFLSDLTASTRLPPDDLAGALWDLVGRGLVAGDGFQPLRDLITRSRGSRGSRAGEGGASARWGGAAGRWALFERIDPEDWPAEELADRVAGQLLARYGIVFREIVARESFALPWRDVARALRLREARGLVRGGRFVAGFIGAQFALPEAVEGLRRIRRTERSGAVVRVSAADPLNLVGILTPGPRVPANQGQWITFVDGAPTDEAAGAGGGAVVA